MFYSGLFIFFVNIIIIIYVLKIFYNIYTITFLISIGQSSTNDSIFFLNIISSPVYTIFFFITFTFIMVLHNNTIKNKIFVSWLFMIILYLADINFLSTVVNKKLNQISVNINLYNGLLNIHPYIIYLAYSIIIISIYINIINNTIYLNKMIIKNNIFRYTLITSISIILGAWWASQELNWGGFWSWDPVELISLLIACIFIYSLHVKYTPFENIKIINVIFIVIIIYFIMRLGVATTVHSFIKNQNLGLNMYYVFVIILYINVIQIIKIFFNTLKYKNIYTTQHNKYNYILIYYYSLIVILSSLILLNFNINFYSYTISLEYLYIITTVVLLFSVGVYIGSTIYNIIWLLLIFLFCKLTATPYIIICIYFIWINKKSNIHFMYFWILFLFLFFFKPVLNTLDIACHNYTSIFISDNQNINISNSIYINNYTLNKTFYTLRIKNLIHKILDFNINSNFITSQYFLNKAQKTSFIYSEEFLFLLIYLFILLSYVWIFKNYKNFYIFSY